MLHAYRPFAEAEAVRATVEKMTLDDFKRLGKIRQSARDKAIKAGPDAWYDVFKSLVDDWMRAYGEAWAAADRLSLWRRWRDAGKDRAFSRVLYGTPVLVIDRMGIKTDGSVKNEEWKFWAMDAVADVMRAIELRPYLAQADFDALAGPWTEFMTDHGAQTPSA